MAAMKAAHGSDSGPGAKCTAANACFGGGLRNDESGETYQFTTVLVAAGLITGYEQNFPPDTSLSTAKSEVLQWMPKDATMGPVTVDHNGGSCGLTDITSPTLAKLFSAPAIGDPQGVIGVEFSYTDANLDLSYDPNNIQDASMSVAPSDPTAGC